ncbi:MAG: Holliday junction resolvase RecU [Lachnospiraceae bacterium]|nr:Holliday junction resolvase RecU [Lachnospiraceae bacterium]
MPTWKSRGLRGSVLEDFINMTISYYQDNGLALIQKIPTPIKPINIDKETRHITLAYFDQKSTVDYIGAVQGIPVCFDAKESAVDTFPLKNIHEHQIRFMERMEKQNGIAFILLYYSHRDEAYYLPFRDVLFFWQRAEKGGRKSFTYEEVDKTLQIRIKNGIYLHFLEQLQMDLLRRSE